MSGPGYQIGHDNREAVRTYFLAHVGVTNRECAKALGLSEIAVGRHIATLRQEWLNPVIDPKSTLHGAHTEGGGAGS